MYHKIKLSTNEKIKAWLSLCDFTYKLLKDNFGEKRLRQILKKMRDGRLEVNYSILKRLARVR